MSKLNNKTFDYKSDLLPQVEMLFIKPEHAQKAAFALAIPKLKNSKISINSMHFEDGGRTLKLTFNSSSAFPSDILEFVGSVVDAASIARPLFREILFR